MRCSFYQKEYKWDGDDIEEANKARDGVAHRFGSLFDASLIEDLLHYYDDFHLGEEE